MGGVIVDTNLCLYNATNINKNFKIKFTIKNYGSEYNNYNNVSISNPPTIMNIKDEGKTGYPGIAFRICANTTLETPTVNYNLSIRDSHVENRSKDYRLAKDITVEIVKENGAAYVKVDRYVYTREFIYDNEIEIFDTPLTFGASINSSGEPFRYFSGLVSNITVQIIE